MAEASYFTYFILPEAEQKMVVAVAKYINCHFATVRG
jgi:hypothetical protein